MTKQLKFKTLALCAILLAGIIFPTILTAQRSDGFFKSGDEGLYENRGEYDSNNNDLTLGGLTIENPTTAPLGSGLLALSIAGIGYAVVRRKRSRRDTTRMFNVVMLLMALVLMLGMTQCKKHLLNCDEGKEVLITLDAKYGGDRTTFDPETCSFVWKDGATEYVEVGIKKFRTGARQYLGYLTGIGNNTNRMKFGGKIYMEEDMEKNDSLYFVYLGTAEALRDIYGDHFSTLHITDQYKYGSRDVTQYHWAIGGAKCEEANQLTYSATLETVMSILYVDLREFGTDSIRMYGDDVYTVATVDYGSGKIKGTMRGGIDLGANGLKFVALIPSSAPSTTVKFASSTKYAEMNFNCGIQAGKFYSDDGNALTVQVQTATEPAGALSGPFSVASGKQVKFSKGNLQYKASTDTWRFADNQYDYIGTANTNISSTYDGWIDLFGWGTSGYHNNRDIANTRCYPYSADTGPVDDDIFGNVNGYGPTNAGTSGTAAQYTMHDLSFIGESVDYDWGMHNAIKNGGNSPGKWRTLTKNEWDYLIKRKKTINNESKALFGQATVMNVNGLILLPDDWDGTVDDNFTYGNSAWGNSYTDNTTITWADMQTAGCVFLPAAGQYSGGNDVSYINTRGYYWSSTYSGVISARCFYLGSNGYNANTSSTRSFRQSVRLVRDAAN